MKRIQTIALLTAAVALLAVPAIGQAHKTGAQHNHGKSNGKGKGKTRDRCTVNKGFVVRGTLLSYTADDSNQAGNQETVTITVTKGNRHARNSGELASPDSNPLPGVQLTVPTSDDFDVQLEGHEPNESLVGDAVRIVGKVAVERKKCAELGDTLADRYGAVNIRKVKIVDAD